MEVATNMTQKEYEQCEKIQGMALRKLFNVPATTPYWGMLYELGIKPIEYVIHQKRLMLFHSLINSSEARIAKRVVVQQEKYDIPQGFYEEIKKSGTFFNIAISIEEQKRTSKAEWKKVVKGKMDEKMNNDVKVKIEAMEKLRFLRKYRRQKGESDYVKWCSSDELSKILQVRLNMVRLNCNFGKKELCRACRNVNESTEHVIECDNLKEICGGMNLTVDMVEKEEKEQLLQVYRYMERVKTMLY